MKRMMIAAALMLSGVAAMPAQAATVVSDTGTRTVTINSYGTVGQSFTMVGTLLNSFGFQLQTVNDVTNAPLTFTLYEGAGLTGTSLKQLSVTAASGALRSNFWQDVDLGGLSLVAGRTYTAALTATSTRLAVVYGPASSGTVDAYKDGRLVTATALPSSNKSCAAGLCDANFRFTSSSAATGAVPEPATWALMLLGFGTVGYGLRRARRQDGRAQLV